MSHQKTLNWIASACLLAGALLLPAACEDPHLVPINQSHESPKDISASQTTTEPAMQPINQPTLESTPTANPAPVPPPAPATTPAPQLTPEPATPLTPEPATQPAATQTLLQPIGQPGATQTLFDTDDLAAQALVAAAKSHDKDAVDQIFGPATNELISGDPVADNNAFQSFSTHAAENLRLEKKDDSTSVIYIGNRNWPFPIPLVRLPSGKWFFDTEAGKQEILARRIGANELNAIKIARIYVEAQREYASEPRDGNEVLHYSQHFLSHADQHDGLFWAIQPGEPQSPLGPLVAQASAEGYGVTAKDKHDPFHGYLFKILKSQGPDAPGGPYNYVINGNMIAGFALIAYPAQYNNSGVMTFIISHQGKLYQKDLGPDTLTLAPQILAYNPDPTWTPVKD